jgi:hypothetical protein
VAAVPLAARWRPSAVAGSLAERAGAAVGRVLWPVLSVSHLVPGVAGAAAVSLGLGEIAGHVFGHGLTPWVAGVAGGLFALALDRKIP